mgnify:CR=1 FL=1
MSPFEVRNWRNRWAIIAVIAVAPTDRASFVYSYVQTRLKGQYNGKWPFSLVFVLKPLITPIRAILGFHMTPRRGGHVGVQKNNDKTSFGNLIPLLCKPWAKFCCCFEHQHGRPITWVKTKNSMELHRFLDEFICCIHIYLNRSRLADKNPGVLPRAYVVWNERKCSYIIYKGIHFAPRKGLRRSITSRTSRLK